MKFNNTLHSIKTGFKVFLLIFAAALLIKILFNVNITNIIFFFGEKLDTDAYGHTNALILGVAGGNHPGAELTDAIMILSLNEENKSAVMLSIPRDLYADVQNIWKGKINTVYAAAKTHYKDSEKAINVVKSEVEKVLGIPIHYYAKINFSGFEKLIDEFGGIDMRVDETINDPYYPNDATDGYDPFYIQEGFRHMDGKTALKYARSRQTTSSFNRDIRQQKIITAVKNKVLNKDGIDENKIKDILFMLKNDIETDMSVRKLVTMAKAGKNLDSSSIKSYELHDDPAFCGGWLYGRVESPENGGYILIPASENYDEINNFASIVINNAQLVNTMPKIQILNGTIKSAATKLKSILTRYCMDVTRFGNAKTNNVQKTTYYIKNPVDKNFIYMLQKFIPGRILSEVPQEYLTPPYLSNADVIIEIGEDYWLHPIRDPYDYIIPVIKPSVATEEAKPQEDNQKKNNQKTN